MKLEKAVLRETSRVAVGVLVLVLAMLGVYALIGRFNLSVFGGALYTGLLAIANFFVMGLTVQNIANLAASEGQSEEALDALTKHMKAKIQLSYTLRMIVLFAMIIVGINVFHFNALATILPLIFPRIVIGFMGIRKKNVSSEGSEKIES